MKNLKKDYEEIYNRILTVVAGPLEKYVIEIMAEIRRIDRISVRAKEPKRFLEKARRKENGVNKYSNPLSQIQDQLGARIIVFYRNDVDIVARQVKRYFREIEERSIVPDSEWKFGYFGKHMILALPKDVIPKRISVDDAPRFFELQIRTLFQHAWSEANHDLGYKPYAKLEKDDGRKLAFTAAQAWGADEIFAQLLSKPPRRHKK